MLPTPRLTNCISLSACLLVALIAPSSLDVQAQETDRPSSTATRLQVVPIFDGNVTSDPGWAEVEPLTNFTQHSPNNGAPGSMETEVFVGYTDTALHLAFICHEDDINDMSISANGWLSDGVVAVIDTYKNEISGYVFSTNQVGAEWDASLFNGNTDWNWSTVWQVKSQIHESTWSAEMVIPFTSLSYPREDIQTWRFNFSRYIKNRNESSLWASAPRQYNIWRLGLAGEIHGIEPPPSKQNIKFNPYGLISQSEGPRQAAADQSDFGFDVRYSLTPTLNLDATYNTDFAHVELDSLRINTGRFSLFFPETRPFFLENARLFEVGVPRETLLFHSRRIGVSRNGTRLPMTGGVKLAGSVGLKNQVGLIHLRADDETLTSSEDFTVARYNRDLINRSKFGFLATNRRSDSHTAQTVGADVQWGIGDLTDIRSFVAMTNSNDGIERDDEYSFALYANYTSPKWQNSASYHEVGSGFNPEVGFAQRRNSRKAHVAVQRVYVVEDLWGLHEWQPHGNYTAYWDFDGYKESGYLHLDSYLQWKNGANMWTAFDVAEEGVRHGFTVAGEQVLPGEYTSPQINVGVNSPQDRDWFIGASVNHGDFYQGKGTGVGIWSNYTPGEHVSAFFNFSANKIDFPNLKEPFDFSLTRLGLSYSFTPKVRLHTLVQYNSADEVFSANLRFAWLRSASTGLYLVYNQIDENNTMGATKQETFVIKYSHMFDINV